MTPLISGDVDCQPALTLKADFLNITQAYKVLMRILCWYFNATIPYHTGLPWSRFTTNNAEAN